MGKLIFKGECQLINIRKITELDNHYFTAIIVVMGESKNHQWILKFLGSLKRNKIDTVSSQIIKYKE